jgi:hypothetical protein
MQGAQTLTQRKVDSTLKKFVLIPAAVLLTGTVLGACSQKSGTSSNEGGAASPAAKSEVEAIIEQAQQMSNEELFKKAIEESNGKTMYGIGNSSRGATAGTNFINALKAIDPSYTGQIEWSQPKENSIFTLLSADINSSKHTYSMTLIQDGTQIQTKMLDTGYLLNFIPKDWITAQGVSEQDNGHPFALQTLNKVFMYNNLNGEGYTNVWDFVDKDVHPMFMGVNSEPVGKNFLMMLTNDTYSNIVKDAFDALPSDKQAYFMETVNSVENDVKSLGLTAPNAKYALAWIKLWCQQYNQQTDDGPISNELVVDSAKGQSGLLVYSKLRSITESATSSVKNVTVAAYQPGYKGFGGYAYKHYLQIVKTSPLPWTAAAFISYMTTEKDGFSAWGKDIGSYSSNPNIMSDHSQDGYVDGKDTFPAKNDKGYDWWLSADGGRLVVEEPAYLAKVAPKMSDWIDVIVGSRG